MIHPPYAPAPWRQPSNRSPIGEAGRGAFSPRWVQAREASIRIAGLTIREQDVLRGLASGLPNKTIARDLEISPRTVEVHRANLMAKLKVHSLSEALRIAFSASLHLSPLRDDT